MVMPNQFVRQVLALEEILAASDLLAERLLPGFHRLPPALAITTAKVVVAYLEVSKAVREDAGEAAERAAADSLLAAVSAMRAEIVGAGVGEKR